MGFKNVRELVDKDDEGCTRTFTYRKVISAATVGLLGVDLNMIAGNPKPFYYASAPLESVAMSQSVNGGVFHGSSVAPLTKFLRKLSVIVNIAAPLPAVLYLMDYLMYYPFIDEGTTDEQFMINLATLPRYEDGKGVRIMMVSVASRTGNQSVSIKYTNQDGVSGRVAPTVAQSVSSVINGSIISLMSGGSNNYYTMFIPLQGSDTGVRSIDSVTMLGTDTGLFTLVLVKPLANIAINEQTAAVEVDFLLQKGLGMPEIKDNASLNLAISAVGSLSGVQFIGEMTTTWN